MEKKKKKNQNRNLKQDRRQEALSLATTHVGHAPPPGTSFAAEDHRKTLKPPKNHPPHPKGQTMTTRQ
jgi:hypothetical protein